jgi:putative ABC transport system ATP-binding protein
MDLLQSLNQEQGITVLIVTHDPEIAGRTSRILYLHDGQIAGQELRRVGSQTHPSGR